MRWSPRGKFPKRICEQILEVPSVARVVATVSAPLNLKDIFEVVSLAPQTVTVQTVDAPVLPILKER